MVIWEKLTISPMTDASPLGIYIHSPSHTHLMAGNGLPSPLRCPLTVLSEWNIKSSHQWPRSGQHWASNLTTYGIKKILLSWEPEISIHVSSFFLIISPFIQLIAIESLLCVMFWHYYQCCCYCLNLVNARKSILNKIHSGPTLMTLTSSLGS